MTFAAREVSRTRGEPVDLYGFTYDGGEKFIGYTNSEQVIVHEGLSYAPVPIDRDGVKTSGTLDNSAIRVRLSTTSEVADLFLAFPPSSVVGLTIRQGHLSDPDEQFLAVWSGRVLSGSQEGGICTLVCEPVSTSMRRTGLRRHYQYGCPHALYSAECGANKAAASTAVTVSAVTGGVITLPMGWSAQVAKYLGGMVEWVDPETGAKEIRTILRVSDDGRQITLSGTSRGIVVGTTVTMILGCNRQMGDCETLHNNIVNFGGQPWIPTVNPIGTLNQFY